MASLRHWMRRFPERYTSPPHHQCTSRLQQYDAIRRWNFMPFDTCKCHNDRLWDHDRIILPKARINDVIAQCHDLPSAGHCGINRTVSLVIRRYTFDHLSRRVQCYFRTCLACQQSKARHNCPRGLMEQLDMPKRQWQSVSMDWTNLPTIKDASGKKFNHMLTVTDRGLSVSVR